VNFPIAVISSVKFNEYPIDDVLKVAIIFPPLSIKDTVEEGMY
jgi:hypothetical protein